MKLLAGTVALALSLLQVSVVCLTADELEAERSGWNVDPETQYHIQTDEGPERYFRFQTLNGQYRKEKRLQDGTVVGTEGWLDPLGYLRIKDYIADAKGFRILKSKMIFVGKDRPIQDALSISKSAPATAGELARPHRPANPFRQPELKDVSSNSIESNSVTPLRINYVASTPSPSPPPTITSLRLRPIIVTTVRPRPFAYTTPASLYDEDDNNDGINNNNNNDNYLSYNRKAYRGSYRQAAPPALLVEPPYLDQDQNHLASQSNAKVRIAPPPPPFRGYMRYNGTSFKEYEFPAYDGTSSTGNRNRNNNNSNSNSNSNSNGFQYYLKKQYHEEEKPSPDKSLGSFGYVDPFGIRRVVYYKAGQNGFVHRKNNRYVGHNAKPYDPQPVAARHKIH